MRTRKGADIIHVKKTATKLTEELVNSRVYTSRRDN